MRKLQNRSHDVEDEQMNIPQFDCVTGKAIPVCYWCESKFHGSCARINGDLEDCSCKCEQGTGFQ